MMTKIENPEVVRHYKYLCEDASILTPYMKKYFWRHLLALIPRYTSANLMSFVANFGSWAGFAALLGAFGDVGPGNTAAFLIAGFGIWFYHTMDNIDGSQARRTGTSSPLGEFMDHWFDTFNSFLLPMGIVMAFQVEDWVVLPLIFTSVWAFWATMWEQKITGTIILAAVSQVEGVILVILVHFFTAIMGYGFWTQEIFSFPMVYYLAWITTFTYCTTALEPLRRVKENRAQILGVTVSMLLVVGWYFLARERGLTSEGPVLLLAALVLGMIGSKQIGDLQRTRLIGSAYQPWDISYLVLGVLLLLSVFVPATAHAEIQLYLIGGYLAWTLFQILYQFFHTTGYITRELGINLFTLTAEQKKEADRIAAGG